MNDPAPNIDQQKRIEAEAKITSLEAEIDRLRQELDKQKQTNELERKMNAELEQLNASIINESRRKKEQAQRAESLLETTVEQRERLKTEREQLQRQLTTLQEKTRDLITPGNDAYVFTRRTMQGKTMSEGNGELQSMLNQGYKIQYQQIVVHNGVMTHIAHMVKQPERYQSNGKIVESDVSFEDALEYAGKWDLNADDLVQLMEIENKQLAEKTRTNFRQRVQETINNFRPPSVLPA